MLNSQQQSPAASQQQSQQQQPLHTPSGHSPDRTGSNNNNSNSHSYFIFDDLSSALAAERNNSKSSVQNLVLSGVGGSNDSVIAKINQINSTHHSANVGTARAGSGTGLSSPSSATGGASSQTSVSSVSSSSGTGGGTMSHQQQHQHHQIMSALAQQKSSPFGGQRYSYGNSVGSNTSGTSTISAASQAFQNQQTSFAQFGAYGQTQSSSTLLQQQSQQASSLQQKTGFGKFPGAFSDGLRSAEMISHFNHQFQSPFTIPSATGTTTTTTTTNGGTAVGGGDNYHFKTLVPSVAAGAIIGKGGETIASLQKDAGARVKMSKAHDFYPGTSERVCLISGTVDGILTVLDFIIDKIREKPDMTKALTDADAKQAAERDKQIKILVPNSTAGMIIGKAGAYIKQIKEESGSYVQISQKPKELTLQERCITIIGEKENNKIACKMILAKIVEDPSSGSCLNVSYADINGPVANFNPTGSPFAASQNPTFSSSTASLNSALSGAMPGASAAGLLVNGTGLNLSLNLGAPSPQTNPTVTTQLLEHIKGAMRQSGYSDTATNEVHAALAVLAKYGVLGIGVGLQNGTHTTPLSFLGVQELQQSTAAAAAASAASGVYGAVGQLNLDSYLHGAGTATPRTSLERYDATFDPFRHPGTQAATPISINNNAFGLTSASALNAAAAAQSLGSLSKSPTPAEMTTSKEKNVEIPEVIVGAILGPAGRSLVEIQHLSGANIQISKKGIFAPGTRNRIVTITGAPNAINVAHYLIEQRIQEEEAKRACQTSTGAAVKTGPTVAAGTQ
ncbi:RNA-binding protein Pasilla isoform X1 [Malaya genurostris]|uniref:RNA-binding protein Pasilla isoform X1 n=2 Tax=Malaya genurostris TaxID=325434 RepID=UPI0026F3DBB3|nr:RNA-binding protein Pasilla isoform X1 [Malaya genurostris]XP_058454909.1 RNA-binding protein Pasilla isoform X1 [Malaya genurostris]XP_058454915.1 RNA-binding protein Pasilla isoform X1 [Malaya genurostris]XP_058454924.1 RNA-binding protein Pasilla isoform X1 [Malaya genurostris]XP_058454934.1 RNA-binding protein Pasilla isoform X1 [Malaya genurostris]